ncbi:hypothetical protein [Desulfogranum japonicum]|uniref:hypothetical protein n=1 Tax=Desulfogranum japonicum TaxID=231447 RepID=UPI000406C26B|nr:hypothetical protein [Desulfogranum japonicum]
MKFNSNSTIKILLWVYGITIGLSVIVANLVFGSFVSGEVFSFFDRILLPMICGIIVGPLGCLIVSLMLKVMKKYRVLPAMFSALLVNIGILFIVFTLFVGG